MYRKIIIFTIVLFFLISAVSAIDSSNWTTANVGYEEFKIPPKYENPYKNDFHLYQYDDDIDVFTVRYVNPAIMDLYPYFLEHSTAKKVNVSGRDAVHFTSYDRHDKANNSKLWFSAGEEFYYIAWRGTNITPNIEEIVNSSSPSKYTHEEFYDILNEEYKNYKIVNAIESQRMDYSSGDSGSHTFFSYGSNGGNFGIIL